MRLKYTFIVFSALIGMTLPSVAATNIIWNDVVNGFTGNVSGSIVGYQAGRSDNAYGSIILGSEVVNVSLQGGLIFAKSGEIDPLIDQWRSQVPSPTVSTPVLPAGAVEVYTLTFSQALEGVTISYNSYGYPSGALTWDFGSSTFIETFDFFGNFIVSGNTYTSTDGVGGGFITFDGPITSLTWTVSGGSAVPGANRPDLWGEDFIVPNLSMNIVAESISTIPEPSGVLFFGLTGLMGLMRRRR